MTWLPWLSGSRAAPAPGPTVDLDLVALELSQRLGVLVSCSQVEDQVFAEISLTGQTLASLPHEKIVNRLERQLERAASLIKL